MLSGTKAASSTTSISTSQLSSTSPSTSSTSRALSDRRLFVSNLAPQLTEHDLLLLFQPHGTICKLDLIFHRSGPLKGKQKGYAFVELARKEEAEAARKIISGKTIKGREIRISYANVNEDTEAGSGQHRKRRVEDPTRPTTLSLVKNLKRNDSTDIRIATMEAKLLALQRRTDIDTGNSTSSSPSSSTNSSSLPVRHPSLPSKPRKYQ